jgi:hypothetical protein
MGFQRGLARVGLAKQAAKGTAVTPPAFAFGVAGGTVFQAEIDQDREELTLSDALVAPAAVRSGVVPGADFPTRAFPRSLGLLLLGALGTDVVTGTTPNFTHTLTPATDVPYLTLTGELGGFAAQVRDCKVGELEIAWDGNDPLEVSASLVGTVLSFPGSFGTPGTDDQRAQTLTPCGGTFLLDAGSGTPVAAPIRAGTIGIGNNAEPVMLSGDAQPGDVFVGAKEIDASLTIVPDNLNEWRKVLTGSAGGAAVSCLPVYGSFDVLFQIDANTSLRLAAGRVAFVTDFPEADPGGGPAELELAGPVVSPASGAALTATLKNSVASY